MADAIWKNTDRLTVDAKLFEGVEFLVNATATEKFFLWQENNRASSARVAWRDVSVGRITVIGQIDDRPVCVGVSYSTLEAFRTVRVAFYEVTSQVADHQMVEDWLKHHTLNTVRWDNGTRWAHTDAMDFHRYCLHHVRHSEVML